MKKNKEYLPEDDRISHEYDHLSKEELEEMLKEIEKKQVHASASEGSKTVK